MSTPPDALDLYSTHAFLFPFEWKYDRPAGALLEEQTDLTRIRSLMRTASSQWLSMSTWTKPKSLIQYNEANYFYNFVRPVLYGDENGTFQVHFQHREAQGSEYVIYLKDGTIFRLELDAVGLSFYNAGVGILSFHCYNRQYADPEAVLKINQFGRRLFPPFFGTDAEKISTQALFDDADWSRGLDDCGEMASGIFLEKNGQAWAAENFSEWRSEANLDGTPGLLQQLLPTHLSRELRITPVLDDRMFVVCWFGNNHLAGTIRSFDDQKKEERDWWYKFVFVDAKETSCQNETMQQEQLKSHSNTRWIGYSTLYGVSRYSFVCLTSSLKTLKEYNAAFLPTHVQTNYFKLAELCLLQRACVMRFSDEVTAISELQPSDRSLSRRMSSLTKQYIRFVNRIYFREVTAQEQGIELYDLLQTHMRIEKQVADLDNEIQELHQFVNLSEEESRNDKLDVLTYLGAFFVVPSFICSFLGVDGFSFSSHWRSVAMLCMLSSLAFFGGIRTSGRTRWIFIVIGILIILYSLFIYPQDKFQVL